MLSFKNRISNYTILTVYNHRRKYVFLFLLIAIAFSIISVFKTVEKTALATVQVKAGRYFSGNISITNFKYSISPISKLDDVLSTIRKAKGISVASPRTVYQGNDVRFLFGGESSPQRKIIGIDPLSEKSILESLSLTSGSFESLRRSRRMIILSSVAEKALKICTGDVVTVLLLTDSGQYNTWDFTVAGIFEESSFFAYASYMRREDLNEMLGRSVDTATDIAIFPKAGVNAESLAHEVHALLFTAFPTYPLFKSLKERDTALALNNDGSEKLVVLSQNAQLAQIKQVLDAISLVVSFVISLFLAIVMIGVVNTYRVMIHNRRKEIGTMRALGMQKAGVLLTLIQEAVALSFISSFAGAVLYFALIVIISFIDFSSIPAAGIFLEHGRLRVSFDPLILFFGFLVMSSAVVIAVMGPASKAAGIAPVDAMKDSR